MGFTELLYRPNAMCGSRLLDLEQIRHYAHRAAKIVRHLLQFARRSTLERAVADLNEIARSTSALRAYELKMANIELVEEYSVELPLVVVNREEIQQVILNLLLNAEHAVRGMGRGGSIRIMTGQCDDAAFIEVADNGPGVPELAVSRIFEPFYTTKGVGQAPASDRPSVSASRRRTAACSHSCRRSAAPNFD
jgi:signal transduction histidine kinase